MESVKQMHQNPIKPYTAVHKTATAVCHKLPNTLGELILPIIQPIGLFDLIRNALQIPHQAGVVPRVTNEYRMVCFQYVLQRLFPAGIQLLDFLRRIPHVEKYIAVYF